MRTLRSLKLALILAVTIFFVPISAHAGVFLSVGIAPPVFPINAYYQPPCPGDGYIWTPGYYNYDDGGYVWMPGAWVMPPYIGALWTPGYWGFGGGFYNWYPGYWGRSVGFYGGINYGGGYYGDGFIGGYWNHGAYFNNRTVNNINTNNVHNVYNGARGPGGYRANSGYNSIGRNGVQGTMQNRSAMQSRSNAFGNGMRGGSRPLITANHGAIGNRGASGFQGGRGIQANRSGQTTMAFNRMPGGFANHQLSMRSYSQMRGNSFAGNGGGFGQRGGFGGNAAPRGYNGGGFGGQRASSGFAGGGFAGGSRGGFSGGGFRSGGSFGGGGFHGGGGGFGGGGHR